MSDETTLADRGDDVKAMSDEELVEALETLAAQFCHETGFATAPVKLHGLEIRHRLESLRKRVEEGERGEDFTRRMLQQVLEASQKHEPITLGTAHEEALQDAIDRLHSPDARQEEGDADLNRAVELLEHVSGAIGDAGQATYWLREAYQIVKREAGLRSTPQGESDVN